MLIFIHKRKRLVSAPNELNAKGGQTIAVDFIPRTTLDQILDNIPHCEDIELRIGMAKCHVEDLYNKKLGRQVASGRMKFEKFKMSKHILTSSTVLNFRSDELGILIQYIIFPSEKTRPLLSVYTKEEDENGLF